MMETTKTKGGHPALQTGVCLAICLAVVLAWFSPWWAGGKVMAPLDLANEMMQPWRGDGEPGVAKNHFVADNITVLLEYRIFAAESYKNEGWVGWSDLTYGGTALYADTMALFDDWTMQLHRWFDFWTAWHLGLMGQVLIAAFGMVLLLRGRGTNTLWSVAGGLIYAANSQFVTWINHRFALGPFCWAPLIIWSIDQYRAGKRWSWGVVPVFIALAFLGGTLQHVAIVALAVVVCWGSEAWEGWKVSRRNWVNQVSLLGRYAVWGLLGSGLAALMLIPCTDALMTSNELGLHTGLHGHADDSIYPQGLLQPLFNLAAYPFQVFPSVLGRCDSMDVLKLFKSNLFFVAYIGFLPTLIGFLAIGRRQTGTLERSLILVGLLLPLTPAVRFLYQRLFLLFLLGATMAFAGYMSRSSDEARRRLCVVAAWTSGVLAAGWLIGSAGMAWFGGDFLASLQDRVMAIGGDSSFGGAHAWMEMRVSNFIGDLFIWSPQQWVPLTLLALGLWGLGWTASKSLGRRRTGSVMLFSAILLEVTCFATRWITWSDPGEYPLFPVTPEVAALREHVDRDGRVTVLIHPTEHMSRTPFLPNTLSPYGIEAITGYGSVVPDGMILPNETPGDAKKLGRFGVSHLLTWPGNPDVPLEWREVWSSPSMELYANTLALPRYVAFRTDSQKDGFLAGEGRSFLPVRETSGKQNTRELEVPAGSKWVRIAENQAEGWEYRSSETSSWRPVLRAEDASMLMELEPKVAGMTVRMRYRPPLRLLGLKITGGSIMLMLLGTLWVVLRGRVGVCPSRPIPSVT
ncbi:hypothetical protein [Haloferula rosea]|uniref:Membrane protein YfhO n=1 Tax=Haloferula rosea TaxID=490093 RepID=A0A934RC55_9BACT|nr:hypothetical protein [Haloferula rosea]MBK1827830.1 hypothetical protein [Haloferula rosea]